MFSFFPVYFQASDQPSLSSLFGKKANEWTCSSCSLTNDTSKTNCVACNTAKPGADSTAVDRPLSSSTSAAEASSSSDVSIAAAVAPVFGVADTLQVWCVLYRPLPSSSFSFIEHLRRFETVRVKISLLWDIVQTYRFHRL